MEGLIKQARSTINRTEDFSITRGRTPTERTPSFRGENRPQKWLRRQLSRQMSSHQSGEEAEQAAAVAAAAAVAVAITSLESDAMDQAQIRDGPWTSQPRTRNKIADITSATAEPGESKSYAAKDLQKYEDFEAPDGKMSSWIPEKTIHPLPSVKKTPSMPKKRLTFADQLPQASAVPSVGRSPTIDKAPSYGEEEYKNTGINSIFFRKNPTVKKTPTFGEEVSEDTKRMKTDVAEPILPHPVPPPLIPPLNVQPAIPPKLETEIDAWERREMDKIKQRYEKLNATILEWEDNKKKKSRQKLGTTEIELDTRRLKAMQKYHIEIEQIRQIAEEARAQAKNKMRNEELKVKEKANRYRRTGELPQPSACRCW